MNRQAIKILSLALVLATSSSVAFARRYGKDLGLLQLNGLVKGICLRKA